MKKFLIIAIIISLILNVFLIFYIIDENKKHKVSKITDYENEYSYDYYNLDYEGIFNTTIKNNNIDKNYERELYLDSMTTKDIVEIQSNYIEIWKKELKFSVENYIFLLSKDEAEEFKIIQDEWENSLLNNFIFEREFINNYIFMNSSFQYEYLIQILNQYRERTIRIKYFTYIIEIGSNLDFDDFKSLNFSN